MNKNIIILMLSILVIVAVADNVFRKSVALKEKTNLIEALGDSLEVWKNKDGQSMAKIQILETQNAKTFTQLATTDKSIKKLQKLVEENQKLLKRKGSGTIINTTTEIQTRVKTVVINDSIYTGSFKDDWLSIESTSTGDSTKYKFKSRSELSLILGEEKVGLFKRKPYAIVTDRNPHTNITGLRSYQVIPPKKKKFIIGPSIGYGILINNTGAQTGWILGGTVTYNLIQF